MTIYSISGEKPQLAESAWVAPQAVVIGRAKLAGRTTVWFNAVIRADNEPVKVGEGSNVQEGAVLHTDPGFPMDIAANVTIGWSSGDAPWLHRWRRLIDWRTGGHPEWRCHRQELSGSRGRRRDRRQGFPDHSLIVGAPAKVVHELVDEQVASLLENAADYVRRAGVYQRQLDQVG
jgi:carbonic anhydrase/acetyltransferase-like protein (isoleucine patch superfamily)